MKILKTSAFILLLSTFFVSCQKEYSLENVFTPPGTWQFNDDTKLYSGNIDSAYIETTGTTKTLYLIGKSSDGSQNFLMHLYATDSFTVGTYKASLFQSDFQYYNPSKTIYEADQFIGEFIVTLTALSNNNITGIFSGTSEDSTATIKPLTLGKFTARINLAGNGTGGGGMGTATGTLGSSAGVCAPITTAGTYTQGVALTSTNTATVQVTVATTGNYTISTNTINGVTFSRTGTFSATGAQTVILNGTGTPVSSGPQTFTVTFGGSTCSFPITFAGTGGPAAGTLSGSPALCTPVTQAGAYIQGVPLTASNKIQVQANVTTVGTYTISTNTVNGVTFSAMGTFTTTGLNNVTLTGTGQPLNSGIQNFAVTFGTSVCNFSINFASDYFPTTINSYWVYSKQGGTSADSLKYTVIPYALNLSGNNYSTITIDKVPPTGPDSLYYRKTAGLYYENFNTQATFGFDAAGSPANVEYLFLDTTLPVNATWNSPNITGTSSMVSYTIFLKMTLLAKAVPVTIGTFNFPDVMKVKYQYFITAAPGTPFFTEERWFARNIGLIYNSLNDGSTTDIYNIGRYQVN